MLLIGRAVIALLLASISTGCIGSKSAVPTQPVLHQPRRFVLPNGVTLVVEEHRASDVAALQLWVKVGARDESPAELGLAHYLEHMVFKGTTARPPGFVDREVERVGGRVNGGTSLDYTYYHTVLPADHVVQGIEMLSDISMNATLDETLLDHEKSVVLEEMRLGEDNPRRFLVTSLYATLFEGHPYSRPMIGRRDLIAGLTRETLAQFYRRHYVPEAFTLVVVGAVKPADVVQAARRSFGSLPKRRMERWPVPVPGLMRSRDEQLTRAGAYTYFGLAWQGPRLDHAETPAVDLLMSILGQTRSSRLTEALREKLSLVNSISAGFVPMELGGILMIIAQVDPSNVSRVETEILREIRRLRDSGVTSPELRRAITAAEAYHEFGMETAEGRAAALGRAATVWRLEEEIAYVSRLRAVTAEEIKLAARRYLDPDRRVLITLGPRQTRP